MQDWAFKGLVRVCMSVFVGHKEQSQLRARTHTHGTPENWEGRIYFGLNTAVWMTFIFSCSLDFGYLTRKDRTQGNVFMVLLAVCVFLYILSICFSNGLNTVM